MEALRYQGQQIADEELNALKQRIIDNHTQAGQRASGETTESLVVSITVDDNGINAILYGREYFGTLETGSKPWTNPYYRKTKDGRMLPSPPRWFRDIVSEWIDQKGLNLSAWLTAGKIMTEGSALYRAGGRKDIYSNEIPTTMNRIANRIAGIFSTAINESITINK